MKIHDKLNQFIKDAVDNNSLTGLNQGVYTFRGTFIVDGHVRTRPTDYAVWDYLGEPRLVDYTRSDASTSEFGDWPIILDIKWSQEVEGGILVTTKPWEYEDKEYGLSFEEE
tara:strand:+ start:506 stop:841 length:336 start_codon:yes stop_codon:yes gene_type:complete